MIYPRKLIDSYAAAAVIAASILCVGLSAASAADETFETRLTSVAFDNAMSANVQGDGQASAVLSGNKLSVTGTFTDLPSPVTNAHLFLGLGIGVPGVSILNLTVSFATKGSISGIFDLNAKQVAALRSGKLYVQINSQKAPDGNLWGWLLPEHEVVGQDVPEEGHWFLPQLDVPQ